METGSLSNAIGEFAAGSAESIPNLNTDSAFVDGLPGLPAYILGAIAGLFDQVGL